MSPRTRARRPLLALAAAIGLLLPALAVPVAAKDPLVLRAGTDQDLQVMNPWQSILVVDFEVFTLNYDLLLNFGPNLEPTPGFAESWTVSDDGKTWTFKIRPGMVWSDGTPATSEDARWTYQLVLDAAEGGVTLGAGYLEGYLSSAGLKTVTAPDAATLVVELEFANPLLGQAYVPILPKHIWSTHTLDDIAASFTNDPPVVGTGPYQAVEFKPGEFIRFARNESYWGKQGAADEVIIVNFDSNDTMVQALKRGEIDYARGVSADAFDALVGQPDIVTAEGASNGYTYLTFNGYSKPIAGGGASTTAVQDPAFRDALGWALDLDVLVDRVLAGHGIAGSTIVPPYHTKWHVDPSADVKRQFDIDKAKAKLDTAGYALDAAGRRLDKEGTPITLRLTWPDSESESATTAQFIVEWWGQLGIKVEAGVTEEGKLLEDLYPPEADGVANFDTYIWGWVGDPDPNSLLRPFLTEEIGSYSDTFYSNPRYDELFQQQLEEPDAAKRKELMGEMQLLLYRDAPNIVLFYDSQLDAYRTDRFAGWQDQPVGLGTPLFQYGSLDYTLLTDASAVPSPTPTNVPSPGVTPGPSATPVPGGGGAGGDGTTMGIVAAIVAGAVVVVFAVLRSRRRAAAEEE